ncbi:MAG TPA: plastocyanin/azurin family copper-binding protein [Solirubrobacteraceae bacterium]|nr:plastocyanin/azurin family copper-binding protein [Solirubrobacteraceae bacterium]
MRLQAAGAAENRSTPIVSVLVLAAALLALAGCGSSSSSSSSASAPTSVAATPTQSSSATSSTPATAPAPAGGQALSLEANPEGQLKYNTTSLTAKAGRVTINFANMSPLGHNVTVASSSGAVVGATPTFQSSSKTLSLNLKPGTYKFYCSVPGHRAAGMEGTLTIQ